MICIEYEKEGYKDNSKIKLSALIFDTTLIFSKRNGDKIDFECYSLKTSSKNLE